MTRQNVTDGPREILTNRCPVCEGDGVVVSDATHALEIERKLRAIAKGSRVQAFKVEVHPRVLALLAGQGGSRLVELEGAARRRFFLVPASGNGHVHLDHFEVLAQGKLDTLRPDAPVEDGGTLELKLVEVGLHDPSAAVGKLDGGYEVVVAGAAKLVGKKVTASVGAVLEGAAYATLADDRAPAPAPITFEAEAEKPTRASRAKKEEAPAAAEPAADEAAEDEVGEAEPEASGEDAPKKKRTRRGTRGGRGRKKPAAAAGGSEDGAAGEGNGKPPPRIHVPPADFAAPVDEPEPDAVTDTLAEAAEDAEGASEDGQPKRKRSRRGSRGGRKRKKPTGAAAETASQDAENAVVDPAADNGVPEYTPMSEWIDDFEASQRG
jgi:hypothetical protein